jgi:hypothetical protein
VEGLPSVRSPEFSGKPPLRNRVHRVADNDLVLHGLTSRAFKPAVLKAHGTRAYARKHHARRAARTARALDGCAAGKIIKWHNAYPTGSGESVQLSVTDGCQWWVGDGMSMAQYPARRWSKLLT